MATDFLQISTFCRLGLLMMPLVLAACISSQPLPSGVIEKQPHPTPIVRPPKVGQEWVYQVRNVFNQAIVDIVTEKVVSVGEQVRISRVGIKAGPLPDEIQTPWGFVIQDPHWSPPQKFMTAIPLWPEQLTVNWKGFYRSRYQVLGYPDGNYYWGINLNSYQWERISVAAGEFLTLRYQNEIPYFESQDVFRVANYREEQIWLSPEVGRWVIRRSYGRYITPGVYWANAYWEDYLEWELISWK
ncbi:hypothetical protein [Polynucleobacter ibericus]|uniref:hypothetical protein n=1 Tax=Polynucleobacter ibericus TaxID=1819725 RepID=UPI001BFD7F87|nr:hypothetical protein [Polynucleobacter ibericus]QWE09153.1 hypothetical protein AOC20_02765 [Polynucleobacter ibericus]